MDLLSPFTHMTSGVHGDNFPYHHLQGGVSHGKDGGSAFLLNVGKLLPYYTVS
jgi:hypothetical protein